MKHNDLNKIKLDCRKTVLDLYKKANAGHIGASLSCLDILIYLFCKRMKNEDKFILSKGHAAAALYTVLAKTGKIPMEYLDTFYKDGTLLAAHPPCCNGLKAIIFGTGSLGHGLSLATGLAFSTRFSKKKYNVYCIISDGDLNEGSTWEAIMFAAQHKLNNLTVIVDNNSLQGFGYTKDIIDMKPLVDKFKSFNFDVISAKDGNSLNELDKAFNKLDSISVQKPHCIIAKTVKGCGVSFMENRMEWHYLPMTDQQYESACVEIKNLGSP